jgi:hypothetical protein
MYFLPDTSGSLTMLGTYNIYTQLNMPANPIIWNKYFNPQTGVYGPTTPNLNVLIRILTRMARLE